MICISTLFFASLVFNLTTVLGAPVRITPGRASDTVPRAVTVVDTPVVRANIVEVPVQRSGRITRRTARLDTRQEEEDINLPRGFVDVTPEPQPQKRDHPTEQAEVVRRFPRRVYAEYYGKREPATQIKETTIVVEKTTLHDTPYDAMAANMHKATAVNHISNVNTVNNVHTTNNHNNMLQPPAPPSNHVVGGMHPDMLNKILSGQMGTVMSMSYTTTIQNPQPGATGAPMMGMFADKNGMVMGTDKNGMVMGADKNGMVMGAPAAATSAAATVDPNAATAGAATTTDAAAAATATANPAATSTSTDAAAAATPTAATVDPLANADDATAATPADAPADPAAPANPAAATATSTDSAAVAAATVDPAAAAAAATTDPAAATADPAAAATTTAAAADGAKAPAATVLVLPTTAADPAAAAATPPAAAPAAGADPSAADPATAAATVAAPPVVVVPAGTPPSVTARSNHNVKGVIISREPMLDAPEVRASKVSTEPISRRSISYSGASWASAVRRGFK